MGEKKKTEGKFQINFTEWDADKEVFVSAPQVGTYHEITSDFDWSGISNPIKNYILDSMDKEDEIKNDIEFIITAIKKGVIAADEIETREKLAAYAHEAWAGWKRHEFGKGDFNADGTWTMPAWAVTRWTRQMNTPYDELSESEKESDRKEARKMMAIMGGENDPKTTPL